MNNMRGKYLMTKENGFTVRDIENIFQLKEKINSRQTLLNMEERKEIPQAKRVARGKLEQRVWSLSDLVEIGSKLSYLEKPKRQEILVVNISKGGTSKSFTTLSLSRLLALSGIKTLVIGLDIQKSFTKYVQQEEEIEDISDIKSEDLGLYHLLFEGATLEEVIKPSDIPTLHYIPETNELNLLNKRLNLETRKEYLFKDKLLPKLKDYEVIIFDTAPSFSSLIENAMVASTVLISPISCDVGCYQVLQDYITITEEFFETMRIAPEHYLMPTLLDKNKISQQIYGAYLNQYSDKVIPIGVKRAVIAQEASVLRKSIFEYDPTSSLATDLAESFKEIWKRILKSEVNN
jgi:chromosome partitioning protein